MLVLEIGDERWVDSLTASRMLTEQSGHAVTAMYVRRLAQLKKLRTLALHRHAQLYSYADVSAYVVGKKAY